ncbi:hypothetical protein ACIRO3_14990 [Streptomyces sp. NPDC102278]|uniref:hypothetical protein n=1 Tax=Streptomyces sp. NPDC102278 TaxID=3366152 RepID=UPI00383089CB
MSDHAGDRLAIEALTELRSALTAHGITLPSLDLHLPSYAATHRTPPLLAAPRPRAVQPGHRPRPRRRAEPGPAPVRPFRAGVLALPRELSALRRAVRAHVDAPCHDLQLCVSELVGNVIVHVGEGTPVTLAITRTADGRTRVEVSDPDPRVWPVLRRLRTRTRAVGAWPCSTPWPPVGACGPARTAARPSGPNSRPRSPTPHAPPPWPAIPHGPHRKPVRDRSDARDPGPARVWASGGTPVTLA